MITVEQAWGPLLAKLVSYDTTSNRSNLELIDFIESYLQQLQFQTQRFYNIEKTKANLLASIGPNVNGGLMLAGHTDVVPVDGQPWQSSPFQLLESEGRLYGRGTSDMKGFLAIACDVAASVDLNRLKTPLYLVFTYDEEVGCLGAKALQHHLIKISPSIDFALIGEPSNYALVNAHKGLQYTRTHFTGKPAHSSCPHLGTSAVMAAAQFLQRLPSIMPKTENPLFYPSTTTFNAGLINGGIAHNIIAEHCDIEWECRTIPGVNTAQINDNLDALSQDITGESNVKINHHIIANVPSLTPTDNESSIQFLKRFLPEDIQITTAPFVTEAGIFQEASIPTVVFGPGNIEQAHQPNEYVSIQAMEQYRQFLLDLVSHYIN